MPLCSRNPSENENCWNHGKRKEVLTEYIESQKLSKDEYSITSLKGFLFVWEREGYCSNEIFKTGPIGWLTKEKNTLKKNWMTFGICCI